MAGVAEAMAASSILLDTVSVTSSAMDDESRKNKFRVGRTCICHVGSACSRMSAAFALATDARGDFVVVPSSETAIRAAFYRYLGPNNNNKGAGGNRDGSDEIDFDHGEDGSDDSYSSGSDGYGGRARSDGTRSYGTDSETDSCSSDSSSRSEGSFDSRGSYDSQGSYDSRRSYGSRESSGSFDSRESYDDVSLDRGKVGATKHAHTTLDKDNSHCACKAGPELKTGAYKVDQDHDDEGSRNDVSEISHDEGLEEAYVAAHHFHPMVIDRYFDICLERRPEDDLIPLFITTMTAEDRRACEIPIEDDECDQAVDPKTGQPTKDQFYVVPSYSLDRAHEDWRDLMRRRLRNHDLNAGAIKRMSFSTQEMQATAHGSGQDGALSHKWEMAYSLAQQMIEQRPPEEEEESQEGTFLQNPASGRGVSVSGSALASLKGESKPASEESAMLSCLLSSSLTPKIISAAATKGYTQATEDNTCDGGKDPISATLLLGDTDSEPDAIRDDESDSQRSTGTKSDCTPQPSCPSVPPPAPSPEPQKKALMVKKPTTEGAAMSIMDSESNAVEATNAMKPTAKGAAISIIDPASNAAKITAEKAPASSRIPFTAYATLLFLMVIALLHSARVLTSKEDGLACSTQACFYYTKNRSLLKVTQHLAVSLSPEAPYYLESSKAAALSSMGQICATIAELPPVKEFTSWARETSDFIHCTPPEILIIILDSKIQSAYDYAMETAAATYDHAVVILEATVTWSRFVLHYMYIWSSSALYYLYTWGHIALYHTSTWTQSALYYMYATPPEDQMMAFKAWVEVVPVRIQGALDSMAH